MPKQLLPRSNVLPIWNVTHILWLTHRLCNSAPSRCSSWQLQWFCWPLCCSSAHCPQHSQSWLLSVLLMAWCMVPPSPPTSPCWLRSWAFTGSEVRLDSSCSYAAVEACLDHPLLVSNGAYYGQRTMHIKKKRQIFAQIWVEALWWTTILIRLPVWKNRRLHRI